MKADPSLIKALNELLSEELANINQYMVHAEMAEDWGYSALHGLARKRAFDEMKHAEKLIERILFLEGQPTVNQLGSISIGATIPEQFDKDHEAELRAIRLYNQAIALAVKLGDNATKEILEHILMDEDKHINQIEEKQDQIKQMGDKLFLSTQLGKE